MIKGLIKQLLLLSACILIAVAFFACSSDENAIENRRSEQALDGGANFIGSQPTSNPVTRTSAIYTLGGTAKVFWDTADKIFVQDDAGIFHQTTAAQFVNASNKTRANFTLNTGTFTQNNREVRYTGVNSTNANTVTIASAQVQSSPNNFEHLGVSGDCGIATAKGSYGSYDFTLEHKSAYLCFLPRTTNTALQSCKLSRIVVYSDQEIAGNFTLTNTGLSSAPVSAGSHEITLTTGSGFPLTNSTTDVSTNGAYMVIAPGTHALTIRYWLETPDGRTGTISKFISATNFDAGKIYDITANFDSRVYSSNLYAWDAVSNAYPSGDVNMTFPTDPNGVKATNMAKIAPNVHEMFWYADKGDIHWDDTEELFVVDDIIYKGGIWIKRKENISGFSSTIDPPGINYFGGTYLHPTIPPTNDVLNQYFYLPALGAKGVENFGYGSFDKPIGTCAAYWTSTGTGMDNTVFRIRSYRLMIEKGTTDIGCTYDVRANGYAIAKFE